MPRPEGKNAERRPSLAEMDKTRLSRWSLAKSLKPGLWLTESCAFGNPEDEKTQEAYRIRDAWQGRLYQPPNRVAASVHPTRRDAAPSNVPPEHDQILRYALQFATKQSRKSKELVKSGEADDAVTVFVMYIKHVLDTGGYHEEGKFDHWLASEWAKTRKRFLRDLRQEQRRHVSIHSIVDESYQAGVRAWRDQRRLLQKNRNKKAALAGQAETLESALNVDGYELSGAKLRDKLETLSSPDRATCELILELNEEIDRRNRMREYDEGAGSPKEKLTNASIGAMRGVSEAAVRKQKKRIAEHFMNPEESAA